jgi:hypothetical protein
MGRGGITETVGIPGSGLSYSNRSSAAPTLLIGLIVGGLVGLFIHATRGSRPAQVALAILCVAFLIFWVASRSQHGGVSDAIQNPKPDLASNVAPSENKFDGRQHEAVPAIGNAVFPQLGGSLPEKGPSVVPLELASETVQTARPISLEYPIINERAAYTTSKVNVRSTPSKNGPILRQLSNHTLVSVVEINGDWARVRDRDASNDFGWVYKTFLKSP